MAFAYIQPFQYVALRLQSETVRVEHMVPNTHINLGKYGSFHTNQILGRPYHLTFEILDRSEIKENRELRIVPAAELHAVALVEQAEVDEASTPNTGTPEGGARTPSRSNVNTHDIPTNQRLTMAEIEALKQEDLGSGRELIDKIMQSHSTLDQKTVFSLAKYSLRKHKKYMKWFTVLPLDVSTLTDWMMEDRDPTKIMEMRNEMVGLVGCWANVHAAGHEPDLLPHVNPSNRYLVVDDTGGLGVAAMAERMGILHLASLEADAKQPADEDKGSDEEEEKEEEGEALYQRSKKPHHHSLAMCASSNSITLVHANQQPNLGLLRFFNFDPSTPSPSHPLYTNLKTLSWLQLLDPESDYTYQEPEVMPAEELAKAKSNRRSAYFRRRRRWERTKSVVDETRAGGFNGLVVTTFTNPTSILRHLVPLLAGGSQIVVYSPHIEPLAELADHYSTARRTAFLNTPLEDRKVPSEDFPVDPTMLLTPMVHTSRVRPWQVLPGRTHPLMTGRGGAEGYVFVGTRVLRAEGKVEARGRPPRNKRVRDEEVDIPRADEDETVVESSVKKPRHEDHTITPAEDTPMLDSSSTPEKVDIRTQD